MPVSAFTVIAEDLGSSHCAEGGRWGLKLCCHFLPEKSVWAQSALCPSLSFSDSSCLLFILSCFLLPAPLNHTTEKASPSDSLPFLFYMSSWPWDTPPLSFFSSSCLKAPLPPVAAGAGRLPPKLSTYDSEQCQADEPVFWWGGDWSCGEKGEGEVCGSEIVGWIKSRCEMGSVLHLSLPRREGNFDTRF